MRRSNQKSIDADNIYQMRKYLQDFAVNLPMTIIVISLLTGLVAHTSAQPSAMLSGVQDFNAQEFRADTPCGLNLDKIYQTVSEMRAAKSVGEGPLTEIMMYMAVKEKLVQSVNRFTESYSSCVRKKTKCERSLAEQFDEFEKGNLAVLRAQIKDCGDKVMKYFGISSWQLAQIPSFGQFDRDRKKAN